MLIPPELLIPRKPVRRRRRSGIVSPALNLFTIAIASVLLAGFYYLPAVSERYPLAKTLEAPAERELILLSATGKQFARRGGCFDAPVSIGDVPQHFLDALLSMEDRRFRAHAGVDPVGVLRAGLSNYYAGKIVQGGSTITQQLAKITYLSGARTFERKLEEALIVLRLELALTKDQILERYLNRAYFGEGCFGLRAAARHYFGRPVGKLTLAQSANLVALLKSPTHLGQNPEALLRRERLVLSAMVDNGRLDRAELANIAPAGNRRNTGRSLGAYYADWIAETLEPADDGDMTPLPVRTSFDPALQRVAESAVAHVLKSHGGWRKVRQAALVAMRPDGRVVAMVGGVDHRNSQFNRATHALRQPGSSFKSFVYLAAVRAGATPDMFVNDEPVTIGEWSPQNYSQGYRGLVSLRQAYSSSINTVAVRLSEAVGRANVVGAARDLGLGIPPAADPSVALGTYEVTLLELTSAYAAFAANAYPVMPWGVLATGKGPAVRGHPPNGAGRWRLMEGDTMREFLQATVQHGTGRTARLAIPAYGKTGTSQDYRDAWFIGFAGNLVVGVWVGNDDNAPMNRVTGGSLPAQIWRAFMDKARRADRSFRPELPTRIAGFRAETPSYSDRPVQSASLDSLLLGRGYAGGMYGRDIYGNAMMFGQSAYDARPVSTPRYGYRPERVRPVGSWVNSQDGS